MALNALSDMAGLGDLAGAFQRGYDTVPDPGEGADPRTGRADLAASGLRDRHEYLYRYIRFPVFFIKEKI